MEKKEHILLITTDFPPQTGGIARWAYEEYKQLSKKTKVTVVHKHQKGLKELNSVVYFNNSKELKKLIKNIHSTRTFHKAIFFHWETCRNLFVWMKLRHIPYAVVFHGWEFLRPRSFYTEWIKKIILSFAGEIWVTSPYMKAKVLERRLIPDKIKLTNIPVDRRKFKKWNEERIRKHRNIRGVFGKKIVLSVGRLVERKDFFTVLKSIKLLIPKHPEIFYVIAGNGPLKDELSWFIRQNGLKEHVNLAGEVTDKELVEWYNISDVFVLTPKEIKEKGDIEGFGIVYHEANQCGLPVIGSDTGGVKFALSLIDNSYVIRPEDHEELTRLIESMIC